MKKYKITRRACTSVRSYKNLVRGYCDCDCYGGKTKSTPTSQALPILCRLRTKSYFIGFAQNPIILFLNLLLCYYALPPMLNMVQTVHKKMWQITADKYYDLWEYTNTQCFYDNIEYIQNTEKIKNKHYLILLFLSWSTDSSIQRVLY